MINWKEWNDRRYELSSHPERHIPKFGGLGETLCGIVSYTYGSCTGKPLCKKCEAAKKRGEK